MEEKDKIKKYILQCNEIKRMLSEMEEINLLWDYENEKLKEKKKKEEKRDNNNNNLPT